MTTYTITEPVAVIEALQTYVADQLALAPHHRESGFSLAIMVSQIELLEVALAKETEAQ
jgi:hypothetical protein